MVQSSGVVSWSQCPDTINQPITNQYYFSAASASNVTSPGMLGPSIECPPDGMHRTTSQHAVDGAAVVPMGEACGDACRGDEWQTM
jgi:hypothetical protein